MTYAFYHVLVLLDEIENELAQRGVEIMPWDMPEGMWGAYDKKSSVVYYDKALTASQRRVTLLHELIHVRRGDAGHQEPRVERRINREVAVSLISAREFITASKLHGGHIGAISAEIGAPVWAVEAFADHLRQRTYR